MISISSTEKKFDEPNEVVSPQVCEEYVALLRSLVLQHGLKIIDSLTPFHFVFLKQIGEGAFSTVYLAKDATLKDSSPKYAIKVIQKDFMVRHDKVASVLRERAILNNICFRHGGHPFVTQLYASFQDAHRIYFVMSFAQRGELLDLLKHVGSFDEQTAKFYAAEIVCAIEFIHRCGTVHRDLKPENILLNMSGHILLADFGSAALNSTNTLLDRDASCNSRSNFPSDGRSSFGTMGSQPDDMDSDTDSSDIDGHDRQRRATFVGTAHYVSPEMLRGDPVGAACDLWSFGCILYQMLSGQPPFRAINDYHLMKKINQLDYSFPKEFPAVAQDLVLKLLTLQPEQRYTIDQIKSHSFFTDVDWDLVTEREAPSVYAYVPATFGEPEFYSDYPAGFSDEIAARLVDANTKDVSEQFNEINAQLANLNFDEFLESPDDIPGSDVMLTLSREAKTLQMKKECLERQARENAYHMFCQGQLIIKQGLIDKKKGMFSRTRMFILTEGPRLIYVKPENMELKGELPFSPQMTCEVKNFRTFFVHTPRRIYYLFDPESRAPEWCKTIMATKKRYEKHIQDVWETAVSRGVFPAVDIDKRELRRSEQERLRVERKEAKKAAKHAEKNKKNRRP